MAETALTQEQLWRLMTWPAEQPATVESDLYDLDEGAAGGAGGDEVAASINQDGVGIGINGAGDETVQKGVSNPSSAAAFDRFPAKARTAVVQGNAVSAAAAGAATGNTDTDALLRLLLAGDAACMLTRGREAGRAAAARVVGRCRLTV